MHVHVAPDVVERRIDDVALARRFGELDLAGLVLKSHYIATAERAAVVRGVVPDVMVMGSITLNRSVGGMNALAVEVAAREGARVVWFPTVDAVHETAGRSEPKPGDKVPVWAALQHDLHARGIAIEPVAVVDADGRVLAETRDVLATIAAHGLVLATGHLSRDEIVAVVDAALEEDVTRSSSPIPSSLRRASRSRTRRRCAQGRAPRAHLHHATHRQGRRGSAGSGTSATSARSTRCSPRISASSSNPPVEDGLALLADRLLAAGFSEEEVRTMAVTNTRRLAGVPVA